MSSVCKYIGSNGEVVIDGHLGMEFGKGMMDRQRLKSSLDLP